MIMEIDFGYYGENHMKFLTTSDLPLHMAGKFLKEIPNDVPNEPSERVSFEMPVEGFLLFIIAARERLLQEINEKLPKPSKRSKVGLGHTLPVLKKSQNQVFQKIGVLLEDSIRRPTRNTANWEWERGKSWLWEVNKLRNQINHQSMSNQAARTDGSASMIIWVKKHQNVEIENPRHYFDGCFANFERLRDEIRSLLDQI